MIKNKYIINSIPFIFVLIALLFMWAGNHSKQIQDKRETEKINLATKENLVYQKTITCMLSVTASERSHDYINNCYDQAEIDTGVKVKRYGTAR